MLYTCLSVTMQAACDIAPAIIFFDELDALGPSRSRTDDVMARRLLTELLMQMTAMASVNNVWIFAATNRPEDCDPALLR